MDFLKNVKYWTAEYSKNVFGGYETILHEKPTKTEKLGRSSRTDRTQNPGESDEVGSYERSRVGGTACGTTETDCRLRLLHDVNKILTKSPLPALYLSSRNDTILKRKMLPDMSALIFMQAQGGAPAHA